MIRSEATWSAHILFMSMILIDDGSLWRNQGRYLLDVSVVVSAETAAGILSATKKHKWGYQILMLGLRCFISRVLL